jgi:flagellar motor switch protein FliG
MTVRTTVTKSFQRTNENVMPMIDPNLRKAAVLLRSLDADTAAMMLGQLSAEEAAALRGAMRALGTVDSDEQADVVSELRRTQSAHSASALKHDDVELSLSASFADGELQEQANQFTAAGSKRFDFLASAPVAALVPYLTCEHAQTIAVVLSHLPPARAAAVLSKLPDKVQVEAIERLSVLGDTDPEILSVLERGLEAWFAKRTGARAGGRRRDTLRAILAAADATDRSLIMSHIKGGDNASETQIKGQTPKPVSAPAKAGGYEQGMGLTPKTTEVKRNPVRESFVERVPLAPSVPAIAFDDLINVDARLLASVLRQADANVLALALAGSREEMVDRICQQMPKRMARTFRRELRRLGPTRLSDVEGAQLAIAEIAARQLSERRRARATAAA